MEGIAIAQPDVLLDDEVWSLPGEQRTAVFEDAYFRKYGRFANAGRQYAYENSVKDIHSNAEKQSELVNGTLNFVIKGGK